MIYLDNSATSLVKPPQVEAAMVAALRQAGNAGRGAHGPSLVAGRLVYAARARAARLFRSVPERVVFTPNATGALNIALTGLLAPGDHVVTTDLEHNAVLRPLYAAARSGVRLTIVPSTRGVITAAAIADALRPDTRMVVLTHGSNVLGTVQPIREVAALCRERGILCVVDAAQTAGLLPVDMGDGYSVVCCSGHKSLRGPQGTGLLVLGEGVRPRPLLYGGTGFGSSSHDMPADPPESLEAGTANVPGIAGLGAALDLVLAGSTGDTAGGVGGVGVVAAPTPGRTTAMDRARQLRDGLAALGGGAAVVLPDLDEAAWHLPVLSVTVLDRAGRPLDSAAFAGRLWDDAGIAVRGGFHCAPLIHERMRYADRRFSSPPGLGLLRFSPGPETSESDIDATIEAVDRCRDSRGRTP